MWPGWPQLKQLPRGPSLPVADGSGVAPSMNDGVGVVVDCGVDGVAESAGSAGGVHAKLGFGGAVPSTTASLEGGVAVSVAEGPNPDPVGDANGDGTMPSAAAHGDVGQS